MQAGSSTATPTLTDGHGPPIVHSVLVVDDDDTVRHVLVRWLETSGYAAAPAGSADEALARIETNPMSVVLCDIRMPGHDGLWLAAKIRQRYPETAVILSSGIHDTDVATESARQGIVDYLVKPFGRDRLREAVTRAVEWHSAAWDARRWRETLDREMDELKAALWDRVHADLVSNDDQLEVLLRSLSGPAPDLPAHSHRVALLSVAVAKILDDGVDIDALRRAALLHDLGKLALPEAVVRKPAPLTLDEQTLVRTVPHLTADMLAPIPFLAPAAAIVRDMAERMDGNGYPRRLRGELVPLASRILAVVDAYDAMTHARVYRDAIPSREALLELERCAGTQFDTPVVHALETAIATLSRID